jgi:hypothetical protein
MSFPLLLQLSSRDKLLRLEEEKRLEELLKGSFLLFNDSLNF